MELIKCQVALMVIFITSNCSINIHWANIQENKFESDSPLLFKEEFFETVPRNKDPTEFTSVLGGNETEITHGTVKWLFIFLWPLNESVFSLRVAPRLSMTLLL